MVNMNNVSEGGKGGSSNSILDSWTFQRLFINMLFNIFVLNYNTSILFMKLF